MAFGSWQHVRPPGRAAWGRVGVLWGSSEGRQVCGGWHRCPTDSGVPGWSVTWPVPTGLGGEAFSRGGLMPGSGSWSRNTKLSPSSFICPLNTQSPGLCWEGLGLLWKPSWKWTHRPSVDDAACLPAGPWSCPGKTWRPRAACPAGTQESAGHLHP